MLRSNDTSSGNHHESFNGALVKQKNPIEPVSSPTFCLFIYFNIDFFLHLSARIPNYGVVRPTLILVLLLGFLLYLQKEKFKDVYVTAPFKRIKWLIIYLTVSFFLVRWPGSALQNLPVFVKAVCFFFFVSMIIDTEKRLKIFLLVFVMLQLIRVYEPLYLNLTEGYWGDKTYIGDGEFTARLSGAPADVINPNELGFVIATIVPFIYYLLWCGKFKSKLLFLVLLPPLLFALILTMSRGAILALGVIGWLILKNSKNKMFLIITVTVFAVWGWSTMSDLHKDRYLSLVDKEAVGAATVDGRFSGMFNEMLLGFTTRPILGNGLGTTSEAKYHEWGKGKASHNLYAELIIEVGLIGAFFFLSYIGALRSSLSQSELISSIDFWNNLNLTFLAIFWMYVIYSVNYYGLSQYYWYLFGGLVVSVSRIKNA